MSFETDMDLTIAIITQFLTLHLTELVQLTWAIVWPETTKHRSATFTDYLTLCIILVWPWANKGAFGLISSKKGDKFKEVIRK